MTTPRNDATERQVRAAAPGRSTWLSANAGSGKTRVLTDRVARLLLSGVEPQHILCLTYTKAAASEMQNRLFKRLGGWAMKSDEDLRKELEELGAEGQFNLSDARKLFARAIETPGGLKIQTIHSFCAALLRRFPLEAGVSPQFSEAEDRATALLRAEIVEEMAGGDEAALVAGMARHLSDETFDEITRDIAGHADAFRTELPDAELTALFGLPSGFDAALLRRMAFPTGCEDLLPRLAAGLAAGSTTDARNADKLRGLRMPSLSALPVLEGVFLSGKSAKDPFCAKIGSFPTKRTQADLADIMPEVEAWMHAVEAAREPRMALAAVARMRALHDFARTFLVHYETAKQQRGWLDFNDLILRARDLLNDPTVAAWVLFRLDGGIDHILVDEAQDTSPEQWAVIERLAREFTSGEGARAERTRTIFVVGDKKQSIYSFQGADPREFDRMREDFAARLAPSPSPLQVMELAYSFRSAPAILSLVDTVFEGRERAGFGGEEPHRAFKSGMPGRVDLWPVVDKVDTPDDQDWTAPVDQLGKDDHRVDLARRIAGEIAEMIARKDTIPSEIGHSGTFEMRPVTAGDFLILMQRRSDLFHEIILACKEQGLPIAGADRLKVGAELAVRDLAALLSFVALQDDELSLAVALKSPLFGWSEQMLFDLAHRRGGQRLWPALRARREEFPETVAMLDDLRRQIDFLRPYDMIERILTRHDGRRKLLARLGEEAEDGIDALLDQALSYERSAVPSLTGFLVWMETDELEIKRQLDSAGDRIRVMTVHGSKGLESPIVILPDTAQRRETVMDRLLPMGDRMVWGTRADNTPAALEAARGALADARRDERDRLLYVALTRAEKWLIVAAAGDLGKDGAAWHDRVRAGMETLGAGEADFPTGRGLRLETGDWTGAAAEVAVAPDAPAPVLPGYFATPVTTIPERFATLSPSDLGGAKALPGEAGLDEAQAKRRGRQVHRLLEHLPADAPESWPEAAARLLGQGVDGAEGAELTLLLDEARRVLEKPALAALFSGEALAEVPVSADIGLADRLHGVIDRLILSDDRVLAVDFKTNAVVPDRVEDIPDGLLRQMGAYAAALEKVFPGRRIETAILWTRNATLMSLPQDLVMRALESTRSA
ncbi:double-strand break repair helicase AddA [Pseudooceanicola sp. LIPI14-2-Ac024]|uniref:double-strand break repair helicase AddA n=1 Tax=Pseudooceanicola sp. LIPI14-2-Ac024 TaxID=3344875 RepID=UPI0035CE9EA4